MSSKKKSNHEVYQERVLYDQNFNVLLNMQMLQMAKKQNSATGLSVDKNFPWAAFAPLDLKGKPKTSDRSFTEHYFFKIIYEMRAKTNYYIEHCPLIDVYNIIYDYFL